MDFELVVVQGRSATSSIKLADGVTIIGRQDDCQLRIKSSQVSRKHCELFEKKGLLLVKDLGSSNGTLVNGKKVQGQRVLEPGDELTIGPVQLRVAKLGADHGAPRPRPPRPDDTAVYKAVASAEGLDDFVIDFDEPPRTEAVTEPSRLGPPPQSRSTRPSRPPPTRTPSRTSSSISRSTRTTTSPSRSRQGGTPPCAPWPRSSP